MFNLKNIAITAGIALTAAVYAPVAINAATAAPIPAAHVLVGFPEVGGHPDQRGTCDGFAKREGLTLAKVFLGTNAAGERACFFVDEEI